MNKKSALLIIDVQVAMFSYENFKPFKGEELLENIYALIHSARESGVPVIYVQHTSDEEMAYSRESSTWRIHPMIAPKADDIVVEKSNCDSFQDTILQEVLTNLGINELIVVGMQTDFCVDTTIRRAFSLGYDITLVQDAHSTFDSKVLKAEQIVQHHNNVLGNAFAKLISTEEVEF